MATTFANTKTKVQQKVDNISFTASEYALWANDLRKDVVMDFDVAGLNGLYFLYKEATVQGGSVVSQAKYALPDDYIDHLRVFYGGALLTDTTKKLLSITHPNPDDGTPEWVCPLGVEFELTPPPDTAADEIKLLYNGLPDDIPSASTNGSFTDYFLKRWPDLHVFGMAEQAWEERGDLRKADYFGKKKDKEKAKLMYHNRDHWVKNANLRFMNWDEYTDYKRTVFPQIQAT